MVYARTSHNTRLTLRRQRAARVPEIASRAIALCGNFFHHIYAVAKIAAQFSYRNSKNVVNLKRYVQYFYLNIFKKY